MYRALLLICLLPAIATGQPIFLDRSEQAGVNNTGSNRGVAFGDYDGDGRDDIYVSRISAPNLLYRALGNGYYEEVGAQAGLAFASSTTASAWGDIDNDGDLDLYLGNRDQPNVLYRNNGDGTFSDISESAGVNSGNRTRAVLFGDVDRDGFIDLYVANISANNYLYHNNGDGTFTDVTEQANAQDFGVAMGSLFFDYDNDGDLDLYLTHDANQPNILYRNNGDGTFQDVSAFSGTNIAAQGMGVDFGDINGDGYFDLYITNLYSNELLLNNGNGTFSIITESAGVGDMGMGWGTIFLDYDNDGQEDIYMVNDTYFAPFDNIMYRNRSDNTFENISTDSPLSSPYAGYGVASSDVNGDGRPDLFIANSGSDGNQLLINNVQNEHHYLKVRLKGTESNRAAIGARVTVEASGQQWMDEVCAGASYASHNSFTLHFGLGQAVLADRLEVRWPNGLTETYEQLPADATYLLTEGAGILNSTAHLSRAELDLLLFPNPAQQQAFARVATHGSGDAVLRLFRPDGQAIWEQRVGASTTHRAIALPVQELPAGLYYCQLLSPQGQSVQPLTITAGGR